MQQYKSEILFHKQMKTWESSFLGMLKYCHLSRFHIPRQLEAVFIVDFPQKM